MNKVYQMSDLEYNAFIEHCKSSETYKEKAIVTKASKMIEPTGEMAREEDDSYLSELNKEQFCKPFEERFGWVNELDGDPGELSAWYRGKSNIAATTSNFEELGLKMYVYTNTDNC